MGRGEYDKAIEDARFFAKKFGERRKFASKAAAVIFSLGSIYEQRGEADSVVKHYNGYLRKWGRNGGKDRQIEANVKIGAVLWKQSCPSARGSTAPASRSSACAPSARSRSEARAGARRRPSS